KTGHAVSPRSDIVERSVQLATTCSEPRKPPFSSGNLHDLSTLPVRDWSGKSRSHSVETSGCAMASLLPAGRSSQSFNRQAAQVFNDPDQQPFELTQLCGSQTVDGSMQLTACQL